MAPTVRPPCTRPDARSCAGERRGRNTGRVAGPQSRKLPETPGAGAPTTREGSLGAAAGGPFSLWSASFCARRLAGLHPAAALGADALEIAVEEAAEPDVDGAEQPARNKDPRLGNGVAIGMDDAAR